MNVSKLYGVVFSGIIVVGCSPQSCTLKPTISAQLNPGQVIAVSGNGFSANTSPCVQISILGPVTPKGAAVLGQATCPGGLFTFSFPYNYVGCSNPSSLQAITIAAVDQKTMSSAFTAISIPWGPTCGLANFCGKIGQLPCQSGCLEGSPDSSDICQPIPCGSEGQPECSSGAACQPGYNLNLVNSQVLCTATCGYAVGSSCTINSGNPNCVQSGSGAVIDFPERACVTQMKQGGQMYLIWACYGGSTIPANGTCICQSTPSSSVQVNTSPIPPAANAGTCLPQ